MISARPTVQRGRSSGGYEARPATPAVRRYRAAGVQSRRAYRAAPYAGCPRRRREPRSSRHARWGGSPPHAKDGSPTLAARQMTAWTCATLQTQRNGVVRMRCVVKRRRWTVQDLGRVERAMGIEPTTSSLGSLRSTTELHPQPRCRSNPTLPTRAARPVIGAASSSHTGLSRADQAERCAARNVAIAPRFVGTPAERPSRSIRSP